MESIKSGEREREEKLLKGLRPSLTYTPFPRLREGGRGIGS